MSTLPSLPSRIRRAHLGKAKGRAKVRGVGTLLDPVVVDTEVAIRTTTTGATQPTILVSIAERKTTHVHSVLKFKSHAVIAVQHICQTSAQRDLEVPCGMH